MPYSADLDDRARYRKDLRLAAEGGFQPLLKFLRRNEALFAPREFTRVLRACSTYGSNLAYYTVQKFRAYRGQEHDPEVDGGKGYPTIVETIITPHRFLRHALELTGG